MRASVSVLAAILGAAQIAAASLPSESAQSARIAKDGFYKCALMTAFEYDANVVAKAIAFKCRSWVDACYDTCLEPTAMSCSRKIMRGEEGNRLGIVLRNRVLKSTPPPQVVLGLEQKERASISRG